MVIAAGQEDVEVVVLLEDVIKNALIFIPHYDSL